MALSTTIKSIQDIMGKDVGVDGDAQRIGQLGRMLFLKILDAGVGSFTHPSFCGGRSAPAE